MQEKHDIGNLFNRIADTYDTLNHLLSFNMDRYWRKKAVKRLQPCNTLLDVATGTADLSIEILRQNKARHIIGTDISHAMMQKGIQKINRRKYADRISLLYADATQLSFEDGSFDAVTCAYGVRNFSDCQKGLKEMYRVLKDGGQLLILEFSYPDNACIRKLYNCYFTRILPYIGRKISKDKTAYSYFCQSVKEFIWGQDMTQTLEHIGFKSAKYHPLTFGITTIYTATK